MRSKSQQQQSTRRIRRERRRLGRFVAFSEMLTDLTPKPPSALGSLRRFFRDADRPHSEAADRQNPFIGRAPERATRPEANHLIELPCGSNLSSTGQSARA